MKILVTGAAGFIGMHVALCLLRRGDEVLGIDNLNDYYSPALKLARLATLRGEQGFEFAQVDVADHVALEAEFRRYGPARVVHLAAQAGVRYSLQQPRAYLQSNVVGFGNILESCRLHDVAHLVYASSSSVYGGNRALPFSEHQNVDHPISLYAATKKANELMAHAYSHLYGLPTTGLRFFTVYGPWGRPDMSPMLFAQAILDGHSIDVFNGGDMARDFTYIDDIVDGVVKVLDKPASPNVAYDPTKPDPASSAAPFRIFNIGNSTPVPLMTYIHTLERALGLEAKLNFLPMQPGDLPATSADAGELNAWIGVRRVTGLANGIQRFVAWFRDYRDGKLAAS
jgi:UDP-glucuronate 4-epimerase